MLLEGTETLNIPPRDSVCGWLREKKIYLFELSPTKFVLQSEAHLESQRKLMANLSTSD